MNEPDLERMLWRWQYGRLDPELLQAYLRDAVSRAEDEEIEWSAAARALAIWNTSLTAVHTQARREALRSIDRHEFLDAVRQLGHCHAATTTMRELRLADEDRTAAEDAVRRLHTLVRPAQLQALPALAALTQRIDAIRHCILEERYVEASFSAKLCARLAERLLERQKPQQAGRDDLLARIADVESLCAATQAWAPDGDDPAGNGANSALRSLLSEGYGRLSSRLLTELEIELGPRRRFLTAQPLIRDNAGAVKETVRERSWDGAVEHYWHLSIARHAERLAQEQRRAATVAAGITSALEN